MDKKVKILAILFLLTCISFLTLRFSRAYFSDTEKILGNSIQIGTWGTTVNPTPTEIPPGAPTPTPTEIIAPTSTETPTPTNTSTPTPTTTPTPVSPVAGSVIINEVMWMGSTVSDADEWIELKNMTGNLIDISNWKIENAGDGTPDLVIPSGRSIPANGYFLIANYPKTSSALNVDVDWNTTSMELLQGGEKLVLKDGDGNIVDETPSGGWPAGINSTTKNSMERNDDPLTGWHTCTNDACNDTTYWDTEENNYGTPKAANL